MREKKTVMHAVAGIIKNKKSEIAFQRMLSGRSLDLLNPSPFDVEIEDIAHGLSRTARWNGQTSGQWPLTVAEHSVFTVRLALCLDSLLLADWQMAILLHDAPEYVMSDLISPFKQALGGDYLSLESRMKDIIHHRFALPVQLPAPAQKLLTKVDAVAAHIEAISLVGFDRKAAEKAFGRIPAQCRHIVVKEALSPDRAKKAYLDLFEKIDRRRREREKKRLKNGA